MNTWTEFGNVTEYRTNGTLRGFITPGATGWFVFAFVGGRQHDLGHHRTEAQARLVLETFVAGYDAHATDARTVADRLAGFLPSTRDGGDAA